jgi:hypothetical protein
MVPIRGAGWDKHALIEGARSIMLVVAKLSQDKKHIKFDTLEVLKGSNQDPNKIEMRNFLGYLGAEKRKDNTNNHFNNHEDAEFWNKDIGRSDWPCCICGPAHTFVPGIKYLLFPDAFGAMKSAEIIDNPKSDRWYKYVKENIEPRLAR